MLPVCYEVRNGVGVPEEDALRMIEKMQMTVMAVICAVVGAATVFVIAGGGAVDCAGSRLAYEMDQAEARRG